MAVGKAAEIGGVINGGHVDLAFEHGEIGLTLFGGPLNIGDDLGPAHGCNSVWCTNFNVLPGVHSVPGNR